MSPGLLTAHLRWPIIGRMGKDCTRIGICLLAAIVAMTAACANESGDKLVFVERDAAAATRQETPVQTAPETRASRVQLSEPTRRIINLCVLPFRNTSRRAELDYLSEMFHDGILYRLEEFERVFRSTVLDAGEYAVLVDGMGKDVNERPDTDIAQHIHDSMGADLILFGDIRVIDNEVMVEPFIVSFENGYRVKTLTPAPVKLNNFLPFVGQFVDNLINELLDEQS